LKKLIELESSSSPVLFFVLGSINLVLDSTGEPPTFYTLYIFFNYFNIYVDRDREKERKREERAAGSTGLGTLTPTC